jgi:hypothetical protein
MIGIIKIAVIIYLTLSLIYFLLTGKNNLIYSVKYSSNTRTKIYSVCWIIGFSAFMGGFLVMKKSVLLGRRVVSIYKAYRTIKKLNKKSKK